jgi:hypothetical protein
MTPCAKLPIAPLAPQPPSATFTTTCTPAGSTSAASTWLSGADAGSCSSTRLYTGSKTPTSATKASLVVTSPSLKPVHAKAASLAASRSSVQKLQRLAATSCTLIAKRSATNGLTPYRLPRKVNQTAGERVLPMETLPNLAVPATGLQSGCTLESPARVTHPSFSMDWSISMSRTSELLLPLQAHRASRTGRPQCRRKASHLALRRHHPGLLHNRRRATGEWRTHLTADRITTTCARIECNGSARLDSHRHQAGWQLPLCFRHVSGHTPFVFRCRYLPSVPDMSMYR